MSPQGWGARVRWQSTVTNGFFNGTNIVSIAAPPLSTIEITGNQVHMFVKHHELFPDTTFFGVDIVNMSRHHRECFLVAERGRRKEARDGTPCRTDP